MKSNLTAKQIKFLKNYFTSGSIIEACKKTGITRATYYQWYSNSNFRKEIFDIRQKFLSLVIGEIENSIEKAVKVLIEVLNNDSGYLRLRAAQLILDYALKLRHELELEERINKIEEFIERGGLK